MHNDATGGNKTKWRESDGGGPGGRYQTGQSNETKKEFEFDKENHACNSHPLTDRYCKQRRETGKSSVATRGLKVFQKCPAPFPVAKSKPSESPFHLATGRLVCSMQISAAM